MRYTIEVSQEEYDLIQEAIERTSRIYSGQLEMALAGATDKIVNDGELRRLSMKYYDLEYGQYYGIGGKKIIGQYYNILQELRYQNEYKRGYSDTLVPMNVGHNGFPKITKIKEDKK